MQNFRFSVYLGIAGIACIVSFSRSKRVNYMPLQGQLGPICIRTERVNLNQCTC